MAKVTVHNNGYSIDSLYKWDTGQVLEIFGLTLPVVPQVHFAHEGDQLAIVRQASMDASGVIRASIPDALLQSSARLCAYICTEQGDVFQTLYKILIPVLGRAKPNDYAPEDEAYAYALQAADLEVVTLEAGSQATVEKVQNGDKLVLRFSIPAGPQGKPGADGTVAFEELTDAQRESLRGDKGDKGDPFVYEDFTAEQLESLRGPAGADGTMSFEDLTEEQRESLRGDPGVQGNSIVSIQKDPTDLSGSTLVIQVKDYATNTIAAYTFTLPEGADGKTYYPTIDADGNLEWAIVGGSVLPTPDAVNIKGKDGEDGEDATINGVNALTIQAGDGIDATMSGSTLTVALKSHNQAASTITAGTFAGQVAAKSDAQTPGTSLLRNSKIVPADTDPTVNGEINWTYG